MASQKYAFAAEQAYVESSGSLYTPADFAIAHGFNETVELFRSWLLDQVQRQRAADRDARIARRRKDQICLVRRT